MKKTFKNIFYIGFAALAISCNSDLDVIPTDSSINTEDYFRTNPLAYEQGLAHLYSGLAVSGPNGSGSSYIQGLDNGFGQYIRAYWLVQEVPTDEATIQWSDPGIPELNTGLWNSTNQFIEAIFVRCAYQVKTTSEYLTNTSDAKLQARGASEEVKNKVKTYRAEARFLRALSYYHAIDLFGNFIFVDENSQTNLQAPPVRTRAEIFNYLESELKSLVNDMAEEGANQYGRVDKAAAKMLLAKLYLNAEVYTGTQKYNEARALTEEIINSGKYSLVQNYKYLFMADNDTNGAQKEIIMTIPSDGNNMQSFGSTTFIISASIGGAMKPLEDYGTNANWAGIRTRPQLVSKFPDSDANQDSRGSFFKTGQTLDVERISGDFTKGYAVTKFTNKTSDNKNGKNPTFADTDFPMFRLADAYLMYAECVTRGFGGNAQTALKYVNDLRDRAKVKTPALTNLTLNTIIDERARELHWEAHRRQDLIRFGLFTGTNYVWQWKGGTTQGGNIENFRNLYPIAPNQLNSNPNLKQNTGY